jgi:uncharacterized protein YndB with AHSA1/START domain
MTAARTSGPGGRVLRLLNGPRRDAAAAGYPSSVDRRHSVELQQEVHAHRSDVWPLIATAEGLASWTDGATMEPSVGAPVRLQLRDATAVGAVLAVDPPQHLSFTFDWEGDPIGSQTVVALDAIDHGDGTHLTLRHVGLPGGRQRDLHEALWRYWFGRLVRAASSAGAPASSAGAPASPAGSAAPAGSGRA